MFLNNGNGFLTLSDGYVAKKNVTKFEPVNHFQLCHLDFLIFSWSSKSHIASQFAPNWSTHRLKHTHIYIIKLKFNTLEIVSITFNPA